jgi:hypothetical protein
MDIRNFFQPVESSAPAPAAQPGRPNSGSGKRGGQTARNVREEKSRKLRKRARSRAGAADSDSDSEDDEEQPSLRCSPIRSIAERYCACRQ